MVPCAVRGTSTLNEACVLRRLGRGKKNPYPLYALMKQYYPCDGLE